MVMNILIFSFLASLIPPFRNYFKNKLRKTFVFIGISLTLMELIMGAYVFPKLVSLYKTANYSFNEQGGAIMLILGLLISVSIFFIGFKFVNPTKNNKMFYALFALLIVLVYIVIEINVYTIIDPIYALTNNLK